MQGEGFSNKGDFDITEVKEAELSIGEPIISTIELQNRSGTRAFSHNPKGRLGERIELTTKTARMTVPLASSMGEAAPVRSRGESQKM